MKKRLHGQINGEQPLATSDLEPHTALITFPQPIPAEQRKLLTFSDPPPVEDEIPTYEPGVRSFWADERTLVLIELELTDIDSEIWQVIGDMELPHPTIYWFPTPKFLTWKER